VKICENQTTEYHSANFTEHETAWTPAPTTFDNGDEIREGHYIYKYAGVSGTNTTDAPFDGSTDWLIQRATNYYAMLDSRPESKTKTQTTNPDAIIIEMDLNNYDTIALLNLDAISVRIEITDLNTNTAVYDETFDLNDSDKIVDALSYYFSPFSFKKTVYETIPLYGNARAKIWINKPLSEAKCGRLVLGQSYDLGISLFNINSTLESYSTTTFDQFGTPTLRPRDAVYNSTYTILLPSERTENIKRTRKRLDAVPILFIGDENDSSKYENLLSYGLWQTATMRLKNPVKTEMSLSTKELI